MPDSDSAPSGDSSPVTARRTPRRHFDLAETDAAATASARNDAPSVIRTTAAGPAAPRITSADVGATGEAAPAVAPSDAAPAPSAPVTPAAVARKPVAMIPLVAASAPSDSASGAAEGGCCGGGCCS